MEKLNLTQQKHTFTNQKKCLTAQNKHKKLKPGLVTYYDIWPGNGQGLFWCQRFKNLSLIYLLRHLSTYYSRGTNLGRLLSWNVPSKYVSKKIYKQYLKATVTKCWCLEQLNTFSVSSKRCPRINKVERHVRTLFQSHSPVVAKAQFPRCELVLITVHMKLSDDRSWRHRWWQRADNHLTQTVECYVDQDSELKFLLLWHW